MCAGSNPAEPQGEHVIEKIARPRAAGCAGSRCRCRRYSATWRPGRPGPRRGGRSWTTVSRRREAREDQTPGVGPGLVLGAGLPETGRDLLGEGADGEGGAGVDRAAPLAALG